MGIFGKLIDVATEAVNLPVDILKDKLTFGGTLTSRDEPYTVSRAKKLAAQADEIVAEVKQLRNKDKSNDQT